eukprot:3633680-Pyramimonas_sp.AAC.1
MRHVPTDCTPRPLKSDCPALKQGHADAMRHSEADWAMRVTFIIPPALWATGGLTRFRFPLPTISSSLSGKGSPLDLDGGFREGLEGPFFGPCECYFLSPLTRIVAPRGGAE